LPKITSDTFAYDDKLKVASFTNEQAEVQAEVLAEHIDKRLAKKQDLKELEYRLIIRLGGMMVIAIGIVATLVKLL